MWKLWELEYLQMDCNESHHIVSFVTSHSLIKYASIEGKPADNLHQSLKNKKQFPCVQSGKSSETQMV